MLGFQVPVRSCRATGALTCAALALLASPLVRANNVVGAWDPQLYTWPLIPVHAVLTPDMRIMTYGTDGIARQTGYFIYDLWDINAGLDGGHLTLDNVTATDIFCGSQVVLPQGGQVFLAGGDNWTGTRHDQHRQQQHQRARPCRATCSAAATT